MERNASLEELLRESGWLRSLAGHLVADGARADDLVQETWLAALRTPPPATTPRRAWLARVLRSRAANAHRGDARRARREAEAEPPHAAELPLRAAEAAEAQRLLAEEILALSDEHRTVVVLRYFRGLDSAEIGRELGVPAGTVRWRLSQALEALRGALDRRSGGERSAWAALLVPLAGGGAARAAALPAPSALAVLVGLVTLTGVAFVVHDRLQEEPAPRAEVARAESSEAPSSATDGALAARSAAPRTALDVEAPASPLAIVDEGLEISGVLLVDGAAPTGPVVLKLSRKVRMQAGPFGTPSQLLPLGDSIPPLTLEPSQQGRFRFTGLAEGFEGRLGAEGLITRDWSASIAVQAPASGLVLDLVTAPTVRGRVREPGEIVWRVGQVLLALETGDRTRPEEAGFSQSLEVQQLQDDGSFAHRLLDGDSELPVRACVLLEFDEGYLCLEPPPFDPWQGLDLGELVLAPTRAREVRVLDPEGAPVSLAQVRVEAPIRSSRSAATDAHGRATVPFAPARACVLRVDALGFAPARVLAEDQAELEVTLARTALLEIKVLGLVPGLSLDIRGPADLFPEGPGDLLRGEELLLEELGAAGARMGGVGQWSYRLLPDRRLCIADLEPGLSFSVEVVEAHRTVLAARTVTLAADQWLALEFDLRDR